jgi:hypothetical protein
MQRQGVVVANLTVPVQIKCPLANGWSFHDNLLSLAILTATSQGVDLTFPRGSCLETRSS